MISCADGVGSCAGVGGGVAANTFAAALQFLVHSQCLISEPWPPQATIHNGSSVDVIIVGAGTAGSALAARLAETNLTVLLLEAGGDPPVESIVPGLHGSLVHSQYYWNLTTEDDRQSSQELENHRQQLSAGKLLGGTGSINKMIYSRPFPADYDELADILEDDTWNWTNVLPYFKKTERMTAESIITSSVQYHGYNGEIQVSSPAKYNIETLTLLDAVTELGFEVIQDRNNPEKLSPRRAYPQVYTVKDGKRQSSLTAMLNKVATQDNLYVLKNALVTKIIIKHDKANGVKVLLGDDEWEFYANKEVIVSAGVYNTPKLLMLSGIGPQHHISNSYNIQHIKRLPVGENLQDHIFIFTFLAAESGLCNYDNISEAIKYLYNRTGSLSIPNRIGMDYSLKSSANPNVPDFDILPYCVPKDKNFLQRCLQLFGYTYDTCSYLHSLNKEYELIPISTIFMKPNSKGLVTIKSGDPLKNPVIYAGTFIEEEDLDGFPEVIEVIKSLVNTTYFKSKNAFVVDLGLKTCKGLEWPEDVKCIVKNTAKFQGHAVGTAAMGKVLDSRMRVLDIDKLRVVDASAIPNTLRSAMNAAIVVLAEKAADFIKEEHGLVSHNHHHHIQHGQHEHHKLHGHHGQHEHLVEYDHKQKDQHEQLDHHDQHAQHDLLFDQNDRRGQHDHHEQHDRKQKNQHEQHSHEQHDHHGLHAQHDMLFDQNDRRGQHDHLEQHDRKQIVQHEQHNHEQDDHHDLHAKHDQQESHDNQVYILPEKDDYMEK